MPDMIYSSLQQIEFTEVHLSLQEFTSVHQGLQEHRIGSVLEVSGRLLIPLSVCQMTVVSAPIIICLISRYLDITRRSHRFGL